jgi:hypothetical protein
MCITVSRLSPTRILGLASSCLCQSEPRGCRTRWSKSLAIAALTASKLEDDRDINLVVAVPSAPSKKMIVEFPDPPCNGASSSPKKGKMASARSAIIAACGQPSSSRFTKLSGRATVTGVGFFDIPDGQTGIARTRLSCTRS